MALHSTHDSGASWRTARLPGLGSVDFESTLVGWQLGNPTQESRDGGASWHPIGQPPPFDPSDMRLQLLGRGIAIAHSYQSAFRTDDGAVTWYQITPPRNGSIGS